MPSATDTLDPRINAECEKRFVEESTLALPLLHPSAPSISPGCEPLYKKLISDLGLIADLKSRPVEGEVRSLSFGSSLDLNAHFEILRRDFVGLPSLCFAHAQLIVCMRRKLDLGETAPVFLKLWATEAEFLTAHLNSRWLISACDTFVDYGSDTQKSIAMTLVMLINTLKLAETERLMLCDPSPLSSKLDAIMEQRRAQVHIELWDGITAYALFTGDMPRNMLRRFAAMAAKDPTLALIAKTLIRRTVAAETLFGRLNRLNDGFLPPEFA